MKKKKPQEEWCETVKSFIGLWNRFYNLYLQEIAAEDVTTEKEDEFLKFKGSVMEYLVRVVEVEKNRFDIKDMITGVINEGLSLEYLHKQSEFQDKRLRQRWEETSGQLDKLYRWCETYDPKKDKESDIAEIKRLNPFWDPTSGGFQQTLTRILFAPKLFFQGLQITTKTGEINKFLFQIFLIPIVVILIVYSITNFSTVKNLALNFNLEMGIIQESTSFIANLIVFVTAIIGILLIALVISAIGMVLNYIYSLFMHIGFKVTGGKEKYVGTYKTIVYGAAPIIAVITAPVLIGFQIFGAKKVHKYPLPLAILGWVIGVVLFICFAGIALGVTFYATRNLPAVGDYVYVTADKAEISKSARPWKMSGTAMAGTDMKLIERYGNYFKVEYQGETYYISDKDAEIRQFSWGKSPQFIWRKTLVKIRFFVDRLSREIEKQAE